VPAAISGAARETPPRLTRAEARQETRRFLALGLRLSGDRGLINAALDLSLAYRISLYDAAYVALAQRLGVPFITADQPLYARIQSLPGMVWLEHFQPV
jgi:predicted nucleic acid-binding protein